MDVMGYPINKDREGNTVPDADREEINETTIVGIYEANRETEIRKENYR